ncbi:MAG TPA: hypothetical protein VMU24_14070 [Candidatus Acidoferrales bacterium]|nr:hypothetical protein [Candidatus Acidoferrales bacterium]
MKPSRVVSVIVVSVLSAAVGWAQHYGAGVGSFPHASVTSMGNYPAASATSMGHLPPWTFNNGFGFGNFNNGFGGFNNGSNGWNSGYGNFRTGFSGWNNAAVNRNRRGFGSGYGGYGYGYYAYPWIVTDDVSGGSFYNDVNSNMNGQAYAPDQQSAPNQMPEQPIAVQQPAPAQPIVLIVDRDGNMRPYDYAQQGKRPAKSPAPQAEDVAAAPSQPSPEDVKTILVFRDGHRREITNYAIMGNKMYLSPHGTVLLSELDIPATVAANDERGIEFRVPSIGQ